jgi:N-methylhydantoinase A
MLATELRFEAVRSHVGETNRLDAEDVRRLYRGMEASARERMGEWFDGDIACRFSAEMRYGEQIFEIDVAMDGIDLDAPDLLDRLKRAFERRHQELYTYSLPEQQPVLVNARVATVGRLPVLPSEPIASAGVPAAPVTEREVYLGNWRRVPVYGFQTLATGQVIDGPAIVESETTTVLLRPGDRATTTPARWLDIALRG